MPFPTRLLDEEEDVVADLRPHWSLLSRPLLLTLAVVGGAIAAFAVPAVPALVLEALLAALAASLLWLAARYARWATTSFVVTTERLVLRRGIFGRHGREILLSRVNDLAFDQSLWQRLLGCGTIVVESGGEHGQEVVPRVPRPAAVQRLVGAEIERSRRAGLPGAGGRPLSIPEQIEKLDELCRRGIISRAELDTKRAQLLDRW
ncbi:MAG: PH domain-containing protein [Acidimicrobiales bacterium]